MNVKPKPNVAAGLSLRPGAFNHPGGKRLLAKFILPLITSHTCYVELFCGGAAILFNKPRSQVEVINDIDGDIVNAFRVAKLHHDELVRQLDWRINSRVEFYGAIDARDVTDVVRAADFFFAKALSFGGDGSTFGIRKKPGGGARSSIGALARRLRETNERLDGVIIEQSDWRRCLKNYDSPDTFFFCDPPYTKSSRGKLHVYAAWDASQTGELIEALRGAQGNWVLTLHDCAATRQLARGLKIRTIERPRGIITKNGKAVPYHELIVTPK